MPASTARCGADDPQQFHLWWDPILLGMTTTATTAKNNNNETPLLLAFSIGTVKGD